MGQKQHRGVNAYYLSKSLPHSLAPKLTMSEEPRQSSKGKNYGLLEGICITKFGL